MYFGGFLCIIKTNFKGEQLHKIYRLFGIFIFLFLVNSCKLTTIKQKYNTSNIQTGSCSIKEQNQYVYNYMKDRYYWYKYLPNIDPSSYSSPYALLDDLRYELDKWSFIINKEVLDNYFNNGSYIGYGFKLQFFNDKLYISEVFPNSPANRANLTRGTQILQINGQDVSSMTQAQINDAFGEDKIGVTTTLYVNQNNQGRSLTLSKEEIFAPSVVKKVILHENNETIGYLLFDKFVQPSNNELDSAFAYFKEHNITKLIVDLRYNSGGLLSVAQHLSSLIIGKEYKDLPAFSLYFNDKHNNLNSTYYFLDLRNALHISEVYFLVTHQTCSASEAVINALNPYIDVRTFGSKTCGKPVGMVGATFCNKYLMPIEFKIVNSANRGDYFGGMNPTCQANDDITHDFGDKNETMLSSALYYLKHKICPSQANGKMYAPKKELKLYGAKAIIGAF